MMMEKAKMSGIIPTVFTRNGIWVWPDCRYMRPLRNTLREYWTGMRLCASWKTTIRYSSPIISAPRRRLLLTVSPVPV